MTVTQDYKILQLTAGEHMAVMFALEERERDVIARQALRDEQEHVRACGSLLAATKSALAKVRA